MASALGYVNETETGFEGTLALMSLSAPIRIVKNAEKETDAQPDYRVYAGRRGADIGGGWIRTAKSSGRAYVSLTLADPAFGRRIYANLAPVKDADGRHVILWNARDQALVRSLPGSPGPRRVRAVFIVKKSHFGLKLERSLGGLKGDSRGSPGTRTAFFSPVSNRGADAMRGPWRFKADAYDRLLSLPCSGWAWEFKRRDPALHLARRRAGAVVARAATRADGSTIYRLTQRCHVAEHFGLHFIPDPSLSAFDAAPFWLPETMSARFEAAIDAEMSGINGARRFHWTDLPGEKIFLVAPGRRDKLVIRATGYMAQIALNGDGALIPQSALFSLTLGADQLAAESLRHLKEFGRVCRGLATRRTPPRGASPQKLRDALIALDGSLARLSRRQIAEAIYGAEVVKDDWENGIHSYKQRTKRLVDKGLALMTSGYRRLL